MIYSGKGKTARTSLNESELSPLLDLAKEITQIKHQRLIWYTPTQYCHFDPMQLELGVKVAQLRFITCVLNRWLCYPLPVILSNHRQYPQQFMGVNLESRSGDFLKRTKYIHQNVILAR